LADDAFRAGQNTCSDQRSVRIVATDAMLALLSLPVVSGAHGMTGVIQLHAGKPFYRHRPEVEEFFTGRLVAVPEVTGPDTRALPFTLEMDTGTLAVYATGAAAEALAPLAGHLVRIRGRRVDLRGEGGGVELWPGSVTFAD
jgi:hypothetical protein